MAEDLILRDLLPTAGSIDREGLAHAIRLTKHRRYVYLSWWRITIVVGLR